MRYLRIFSLFNLLHIFAKLIIRQPTLDNAISGVGSTETAGARSLKFGKFRYSSVISPPRTDYSPFNLRCNGKLLILYSGEVAGGGLVI